MKYLDRAKPAQSKLLRAPLMKPRTSHAAPRTILSKKRLNPALTAQKVVKNLINHSVNAAKNLTPVDKELIDGCAVGYIKISASAAVPCCGNTLIGNTLLRAQYLRGFHSNFLYKRITTKYTDWEGNQKNGKTQGLMAV